MKFAGGAAEEYRIVVLGRFERWESRIGRGCRVGQIVAWQLQQAVPEPTVRVRDPGVAGRLAREPASQAGRAERRPEAVIIYSGHNEFAARFEEERDRLAR